METMNIQSAALDAQTFPDPDLGSDDTVSDEDRLVSGRAFLSAVELALGIMDVAKIDDWADLPEQAFRVFEGAGIVLTEQQAELLAAHDSRLVMLRRTIRASGGADGRKKLQIAVCPECSHGWRLFSEGVPGNCVASLGCKGKMRVPKALPTVAKLDELAAKEAANLAEAARDDGPDDGAVAPEPAPAQAVQLDFEPAEPDPEPDPEPGSERSLEPTAASVASTYVPSPPVAHDDDPEPPSVDYDYQPEPEPEHSEFAYEPREDDVDDDDWLLDPPASVTDTPTSISTGIPTGDSEVYEEGFDEFGPL